MSTSPILTIDIELYVKESRTIPKGHHYIILIDRQRIKIDHEVITGREILILAAKVPPERFQLNQRFRTGKVLKVGYSEKVNLLAGEAEKFMTIPLDQTEGGN